MIVAIKGKGNTRQWITKVDKNRKADIITRLHVGPKSKALEIDADLYKRLLNLYPKYVFEVEDAPLI